MKIITAIVLMSLVCLAVSCRRNDRRTMLIDVPGMKDTSSEAQVRGILMKIDGIAKDVDGRLRIESNLEDRTVLVTFDSMRLSLKNIEHALADAGYEANDVPPNPQSVGLPERKAAP